MHDAGRAKRSRGEKKRNTGRRRDEDEDVKKKKKKHKKIDETTSISSCSSSFRRLFYQTHRITFWLSQPQKHIPAGPAEMSQKALLSRLKLLASAPPSHRADAILARTTTTLPPLSPWRAPSNGSFAGRFNHAIQGFDREARLYTWKLHTYALLASVVGCGKEPW